MKEKKHIVLIAHDNLKFELLDWVKQHRRELSQHSLYATGTTGKVIGQQLDLKIKRFQSGPLGGDLEIGALIAKGKIDCMIFFLDPLEPQPHDVDVKALLRIAVVYDIAVATNRASADFIISSPWIAKSYKQKTMRMPGQRR